MALAAVGLTLAGCGGTASSVVTHTVTRTHTVTTTRTVTTTPGRSTAAAACTGGDLAGSFALVPGSAGAGQVEYALTLTNTSQSACYVTGTPQAQLLGKSGSTLPTNVQPARAGAATAVLVSLTPGAIAVANARFSPDVPGQGDSKSGRCEPKAYTLRVQANGGGSVDLPVQPPTSVCERGLLTFELFHASS